MPSITIPDRLYNALKAEAAARGVTVDEVATERLLAESRASAHQFLAQSRAQADEMWPDRTDDEVMEWAVALTREVREERLREREQAQSHH